MNKEHWDKLYEAKDKGLVVRVIFKWPKPDDEGNVKSVVLNSRFQILNEMGVIDYDKKQIKEIEFVSLSDLFAENGRLKRKILIIKEKLKNLEKEI